MGNNKKKVRPYSQGKTGLLHRQGCQGAEQERSTHVSLRRRAGPDAPRGPRVSEGRGWRSGEARPLTVALLAFHKGASSVSHLRKKSVFTPWISPCSLLFPQISPPSSFLLSFLQSFMEPVLQPSIYFSPEFNLLIAVHFSQFSLQFLLTFRMLLFDNKLLLFYECNRLLHLTQTMTLWRSGGPCFCFEIGSCHLANPPGSASPVLRFEVCTTISGSLLLVSCADYLT